ncbi:hypothetical protein [Actinoplanes flavus]|nr:hypothetical protein [Actinoplanes flavus]
MLSTSITAAIAANIGRRLRGTATARKLLNAIAPQIAHEIATQP